MAHLPAPTGRPSIARGGNPWAAATPGAQWRQAIQQRRPPLPRSPRGHAPMRHLLALACCLAATAAFADAPRWKAGVATEVITPKKSMWLAGYGGRTKPSEGKEHDLYVKALALEDPSGDRFVILTSDLI